LGKLVEISEKENTQMRAVGKNIWHRDLGADKKSANKLQVTQRNMDKAMLEINRRDKIQNAGNRGTKRAVYSRK
jgi:hypothetical protein